MEEIPFDVIAPELMKSKQQASNNLTQVILYSYVFKYSWLTKLQLHVQGRKEEHKNPEKAKGKSKANLLKPATTQELNALRETENLFHSNLFKLQVRYIFTFDPLES